MKKSFYNLYDISNVTHLIQFFINVSTIKFPKKDKQLLMFMYTSCEMCTVRVKNVNKIKEVDMHSF